MPLSTPTGGVAYPCLISSIIRNPNLDNEDMGSEDDADEFEDAMEELVLDCQG